MKLRDPDAEGDSENVDKLIILLLHTNNKAECNRKEDFSYTILM